MGIAIIGRCAGAGGIDTLDRSGFGSGWNGGKHQIRGRREGA